MNDRIDDDWWIESPVPGLRFKVTLESDEELDPTAYEDGEFTPEQIKAYEDDLWEYVIVQVTPVYHGSAIAECSASLSGVNCGFFDPGGERIGREKLALYPVADLVKEATRNLGTNKLDIEIMSERQAAEAHELRAQQLNELRTELKMPRETGERVLCEAHKGIHVESPECVYPHLVAPQGPQPQVGHPYRVTD
jgi:hypothetical protein